MNPFVGLSMPFSQVTLAVVHALLAQDPFVSITVSVLSLGVVLHPTALCFKLFGVRFDFPFFWFLSLLGVVLGDVFSLSLLSF